MRVSERVDWIGEVCRLAWFGEWVVWCGGVQRWRSC
jgi:hypothetical protein